MICKHRHSTFTRHQELISDDLIGEMYFDFFAWQCDDCGMLLRRDATYEEMATLPAAKFDVAAYHKALDHTLMAVFGIPEGQPEVQAVRFLLLATKGAR